MQIQKRKQGGTPIKKKTKSCQSESASSSEVKPTNDITMPVKSAGKSGIDKRSSKRIAENVLVAKKKRQKKMVTSDSDRRESEDNSNPPNVKCTSSRKSRRKESPLLDSDRSLQDEAASGASNESESNQPVTSSAETLKKEEFIDENMHNQDLVDSKSWKPFEKALYEKGIQIFGRNRLNTIFSLLLFASYYNPSVLAVNYMKITSCISIHSHLANRSLYFRSLSYQWNNAEQNFMIHIIKIFCTLD